MVVIVSFLKAFTTEIRFSQGLEKNTLQKVYLRDNREKHSTECTLRDKTQYLSNINSERSAVRDFGLGRRGTKLNLTISKLAALLFSNQQYLQIAVTQQIISKWMDATPICFKTLHNSLSSTSAQNYKT